MAPNDHRSHPDTEDSFSIAEYMCLESSELRRSYHMRRPLAAAKNLITFFRNRRLIPTGRHPRYKDTCFDTVEHVFATTDSSTAAARDNLRNLVMTGTDVVITSDTTESASPSQTASGPTAQTTEEQEEPTTREQSFPNPGTTSGATRRGRSPSPDDPDERPAQRLRITDPAFPVPDPVYLPSPPISCCDQAVAVGSVRCTACGSAFVTCPGCGFDHAVGKDQCDKPRCTSWLYTCLQCLQLRPMQLCLSTGCTGQARREPPLSQARILARRNGNRPSAPASSTGGSVRSSDSRIRSDVTVSSLLDGLVPPQSTSLVREHGFDGDTLLLGPHDTEALLMIAKECLADDKAIKQRWTRTTVVPYSKDGFVKLLDSYVELTVASASALTPTDLGTRARAAVLAMQDFQQWASDVKDFVNADEPAAMAAAQRVGRALRVRCAFVEVVLSIAVMCQVPGALLGPQPWTRRTGQLRRVRSTVRRAYLGAGDAYSVSGVDQGNRLTMLFLLRAEGSKQSLPAQLWENRTIFPEAAQCSDSFLLRATAIGLILPVTQTVCGCTHGDRRWFKQRSFRGNNSSHGGYGGAGGNNRGSLGNNREDSRLDSGNGAAATAGNNTSGGQYSWKFRGKGGNFNNQKPGSGGNNGAPQSDNGAGNGRATSHNSDDSA